MDARHIRQAIMLAGARHTDNIGVHSDQSTRTVLPDAELLSNECIRLLGELLVEQPAILDVMFRRGAVHGVEDAGAHEAMDAPGARRGAPRLLFSGPSGRPASRPRRPRGRSTARGIAKGSACCYTVEVSETGLVLNS